MITLIEVYNNIQYRPGVRAAFGFACYLQEAHLLFDTGGDGSILLHNLEQMHIEPDEIRMVVLSHDHADHTGGLDTLLAGNPSITVCIHDGFGPRTRERIRRYGEPRIVREWEQITEGTFSTGPLFNGVIEQSLAISVRGRFLVLCGCSHPHIGRILEHVSRFGSVWGAIGGFHAVSEDDIRSLERIGYVSPSHCTQQREQIREHCGDGFVEGGVGKIHRFETDGDLPGTVD